MQEEWKPLIYHGEDFGDVYEISNTGKLRNCITGKERKLNIHPTGYYYAVISRGRKRKIMIKIHRAVAENFVNGDKSLTVNHIDGNKLNNNADNLEFVTNLENYFHAAKHGLTIPPAFSKTDIENIRELHENGMSINKISQIYGVHHWTVSAMLNGESYKYADEPWFACAQ